MYFFWTRIVFRALLFYPILVPIIFVFIGIIIVIVFGVVVIGGFFFGYTWDRDNGTDRLTRKFKLPEIKDHRIWPISVILPALVIYLVVHDLFLSNSRILVAGENIGVFFSNIFNNYIGTPEFFSVFALLTGAIFIFMGIKKWSEDDIYDLFKKYLKAKKEKVCPRIEFIDHN